MNLKGHFLRSWPEASFNSKERSESSSVAAILEILSKCRWRKQRNTLRKQKLRPVKSCEKDVPVVYRGFMKGQSPRQPSKSQCLVFLPYVWCFPGYVDLDFMNPSHMTRRHMRQMIDRPNKSEAVGQRGRCLLTPRCSLEIVLAAVWRWERAANFWSHVILYVLLWKESLIANRMLFTEHEYSAYSTST